MDEWVWSNGGMIVTGENWSTGRKTLYSVGGRWMNEYGAMVEWYWQGKTEVLAEKHYTAWVVDGWMIMEQWWNDSGRPKQKCWKRNLSRYHSAYYTIRMDWPGVEPSLCSQCLATNRLSHGTAHFQALSRRHTQLLIWKVAWRFNYGFWWYRLTQCTVHSSTPVCLSVSLASTNYSTQDMAATAARL